MKPNKAKITQKHHNQAYFKNLNKMSVAYKFRISQFQQFCSVSRKIWAQFRQNFCQKKAWCALNFDMRVINYLLCKKSCKIWWLYKKNKVRSLAIGLPNIIFSKKLHDFLYCLCFYSSVHTRFETLNTGLSMNIIHVEI